MSEIAFYAVQFAFASLSGPLACTVKLNWDKPTPKSTGAGKLLSLLRCENEPEARPADIEVPPIIAKAPNPLNAGICARFYETIFQEVSL